ncbi:MAG TPA: hypothetical protein VIY48_16370 [Candidatus Paceibacterota bacterium]
MVSLCSLSTYLPDPLASALEIGPGEEAALATELVGAYPHIKLYLMDGDGTAPPRSAYRPTTEAWFSRDKAVASVLASHPEADVTGVPPDPSLSFPGLDLIISTQSWGYHYPVETYLGLAVRSLRPGGRIILDHRMNAKAAHGGEQAMLEAGFAKIAVTERQYKWHRAVYENSRDGRRMVW